MKKHKTPHRLLAAVLSLIVALSLLPVTVSAEPDSAETLKATIEAAYSNAFAAEIGDDRNIVTVTNKTEGAANVTDGLELAIPADITVVWNATLTAETSLDTPLIQTTGDGSFEAGEDAVIIGGTGAAIEASGKNAKVTVSGGTVKSAVPYSNATGVIHMSSTPDDPSAVNVTISDGLVENTVTAAFLSADPAVRTEGSVLMRDGKIKNPHGVGISAYYGYSYEKPNPACAAVTVTGGEIEVIVGTAIEASGHISLSGCSVTAGYELISDIAHVGEAIRCSNGNVTVGLGARVISKMTSAITAYAPNAKVSVNGGVVFGAGQEICGTISGVDYVSGAIEFGEDNTADDRLTVGAESVVVAWDNWDTEKQEKIFNYYTGTDDRLKCVPEGASAVWAQQNEKNGVDCRNGESSLFIAFPNDIVLTPPPAAVTHKGATTGFNSFKAAAEYVGTLTDTSIESTVITLGVDASFDGGVHQNDDGARAGDMPTKPCTIDGGGHKLTATTNDIHLNADTAFQNIEVGSAGNFLWAATHQNTGFALTLGQSVTFNNRYFVIAGREASSKLRITAAIIVSQIASFNSVTIDDGVTVSLGKIHSINTLDPGTDSALAFIARDNLHGNFHYPRAGIAPGKRIILKNAIGYTPILGDKPVTVMNSGHITLDPAAIVLGGGYAGFALVLNNTGGQYNYYDYYVLADPVTSVELSAPTVTYGDSATLTATLKVGDAAATNRAGDTVELYNGTTLLCEGIVDAEGKVTYDWGKTNAGTYDDLKAVYQDIGRDPVEGTATLTVNKKELTITGAAVENKVFNGKDAANMTGVTFGKLAPGDSLTLGTDYTLTGVFTDVNAGDNKAVTVTVTLQDTAAANNYTISGTGTATAAITPKPIGGTMGVTVTNGTGSDAARIDAGDTLTANTSGITGYVEGFSILTSTQWYRDGVAISGATGVTYTVTVTDAGTRLSVRVTSIDGGNYSGTLESAPIAVGKIPLDGSVSIEKPTWGSILFSNDVVGKDLTLVKSGSFPAAAEYDIRWLRNSAVIPGATGKRYKLVKEDVGKTLSAQAVGKGDYTGAVSNSVEIPCTLPHEPVATATPGDGQVTLRWETPFGGGMPILGYDLQVYLGADETQGQIAGSPFTLGPNATSYTVTGLTNGQIYLFKLWVYTEMSSVGFFQKATPAPQAPPIIDGDSSSDSGPSIIVTPPSAEQPNAPTQGEIKVDAQVSGSNATVDTTEKAIAEAFDKALAEAKKNGNQQNGITLVLVVNTGGQAVSSVTVNLPKAVQDFIISKGIVNTVVVVDNPNIIISMNLAAVEEINKQAGSDVNITATRRDNSKLTGSARIAIGSRPVFDLTVSYGNGKAVSSFGAGSVSVAIPYTLGANENAGSVQAVFVDTDGKVHWLTSSVYDSVNKVLRFSTNHFSTYGVGYKQDAPAFTDVGTHWAKDDIAFVVNRGLFSGTSATTFSPNTAMTRGMFVTALGRLANADVSVYAQSSFTDVKGDAYSMGYIEWASENGIVNGVGNGRFAPDQSITREQMAVIMTGYAKTIGFALPNVHGENTFADSAKISAYAKEAVMQMQMAGVISGKNGNLFDPQGTATRAEVSAVLRRFVELAISSGTAQGWTMNDSGKWMYFDAGRPVTGKKDINGTAYTFDQYGVTADVPKNLRYIIYTVQKGDSLWSISLKLDCTISELERLNNTNRFVITQPGDVLQVPEK